MTDSDLAERLVLLERQVAALQSYLLADKAELDRVLDIVANSIGSESFTIFSLRNHALMIQDEPLLSETTSAHKLAQLFGRAADVGYRIERQGKNANGIIWRIHG